MIYVLGDSFTFGYNFYNQNKSNRQELIYSYFLGKKLNSEVINLSIPGNSNCRTARILNNINLTEQDYVVIAWSVNDRSEIGVSKESLSPNDNFFDLGDLDKELPYNKKDIVLHAFERDNNIITAKLFPSLYYKNLNNIKNNPLQKIVELFYKNFYNKDWSDNMFLVFFNSVVYKCNRSGCKFIMFNTFRETCSNQHELLNIPNYFLGCDNNITSIIRPNARQKFLKFTNLDYWNEEEHIKIADLIYNKLEELYDIQ